MADEKKKGFLAEFKEFISRGNVIDMAVGVIIGGAFGTIAKSLVDDIFMPIITLATKGIHFEDWFIALDGGSYKTLAEAQAAGASTLNYGTFLNNVLYFLLVALMIFIMIRAINKLHRKKDEAPAPKTTKICPFCKNEISKDATRCGFCTSQLEK
jgi:large conductance mechanosensitive channel